MQTISINELQQNLGLYLKKVKDGDEIVVEETGEAIVRILPFEQKDEAERLVGQGLMSLPKRELPEDFWDAEVPDVLVDTVNEVIRAERDED